jgi:hypothetical protein
MASRTQSQAVSAVQHLVVPRDARGDVTGENRKAAAQNVQHEAKRRRRGQGLRGRCCIQHPVMRHR